MNETDIDRGASLLIAARRAGPLVDALPEASRPRSAAEAYTIQLAIIAALGDAVTGWKVALSADYGLLYAALLRSRVFADGTTVASTDLAMIGVEAEIAFRFDAPIPPRAQAYTQDDIATAVTALPAIEILDSRFRDYDGTPVIDRAADFMSNSAFVTGAPRADWRSFDLSRLEARLVVNGQEIVRQTGGHAAGDPLRPAVALANELRQTTGIPAGHVVTTGTYTGLQFVGRDSDVEAVFTGFGSVRCRFDPRRPAEQARTTRS